MNDLLRRQRALEKLRAKYQGKEFVRGKFDCVPMLRSHLVQMGHRGLPKVPAYRTEGQAKRALETHGYGTLEGLLDSLLPRITYAEAMPGDVVLLRGEDKVDAVTIMVSARKVAGWHPDAPAFAIMTPHDVIGAWRA